MCMSSIVSSAWRTMSATAGPAAGSLPLPAAGDRQCGFSWMFLRLADGVSRRRPRSPASRRRPE